MEVFTLEPGAADLFGEQAVFDRMIDVLEELAINPPTIDAIDLSVSTSRIATLESALAGAALERSELASTDKGTAEVAASEFVREPRLSIALHFAREMPSALERIEVTGHRLQMMTSQLRTRPAPDWRL